MTTILLVEDNEPSRDALGRRLAGRGYGVRPAVADSKPIRFERLLDKIEAMLGKGVDAQ
jgi:hypothetical protein